jgi:hypothetical protein
MKKTIALVAIVVIVFSALYVRSKADQERRENRYREGLVLFQRDLHAGMTRADIQSYLSSKRATFYPVFYREGGLGRTK